MLIFIDCEWNDFQGDLISMALVSQEGKEFYEVLPYDNTSDWVSQNVIPVLEKYPTTFDNFQMKLASYLNQFDNVVIIADWPEDIHHFCESLITGPGKALITPELTMMVRSVDYSSKVPHNALWDARALKESYMSYYEYLERDDTPAFCMDCGEELEAVRPGTDQCNSCG